MSAGTGNNKLTIDVAQDYYLKDAQFQVLVDGKQVGGTYTVTGTVNSQTTDQFTLYGDWGGGKHDVQIVYLNDAFNAATGQDANLRISNITLDGISVLSSPAYMFGNGSRSFAVDTSSVASSTMKTIAGTAATDTLTGTSAHEIITGGRNNDVMTGGGGRDIFVLSSGDGNDKIMDFAATGAGSDVLRLSGYMISSFDDLKPHMRQSGANTVIEMAANNYAVLTNVKMSDLTAANFEFVNAVAAKNASSQTIGTGSNQLVLKLTQDFFQGADAKYTVAVDGVQVGGVNSLSAVRLTGKQDTLTVKGDWAAGNHKITVTFLNDAFNGTTFEDRNLIIEGASINGVNIASAAHVQSGNGSYSFVAAVPAPVVTAPVVTPPLATAPVETVPVVEPKPIVVDTTHDLFSYARGEGAKVITGFSAAGDGSDMLRLSDFGLLNKAANAYSITSFAELKSHMSQVGADTVISLSSTDSITLKDVKAADLTAANLSFMSKIDGAMEAATNNGWIVFNNTWGSSDFTYGKDYRMTATYDLENMALGTTFTWDYGAARYDYTKVLGYPSVMFGYDTFGNAGYVGDRSQSLPVKISNLDALTTKFDVDWGGDKAGYDVSYDIWLTNKPNGIWSDITNEVMIWLHKGDMGIWGSQVGTYTDGNYSAKIYHTGTYTALVPDKDYKAGDIDVADVLKKLVSLGIVSTSEYVNQIDLGAEPWKGSGSLSINSLSYDIESHDASGVLTHSYADGSATEVTKTGTAKGDVLMADGALIATLKGGAGNDSFQFTKGKTGAVTVEDFHAYTTASAEHDLLKFVGYGSGATLVHDDADAWSIHYAGGVDHITLHNVTSLSSSDYLFV
ncbi:MAG: carbohydrate-binding domain-containing protein [Sphingobium sp.]|nr:carbohydrate-binding domain-containing protein [Sphingobium sp.]